MTNPVRGEPLWYFPEDHNSGPLEAIVVSHVTHPPVSAIDLVVVNYYGRPFFANDIPFVDDGDPPEETHYATHRKRVAAKEPDKLSAAELIVIAGIETPDPIAPDERSPA